MVGNGIDFDFGHRLRLWS